MDLVKRAQNGEYLSKDSIHLKGKKFKTRIGRTVYSEGGVMPDYFVPEDTLGMTSYYIQSFNQGLIARFPYIYIDDHREKLDGMDNWKEMEKYLKKQDLPHKFATWAAKNGLKQRNNLLRKSYKLFQSTLISYILDDYYGTETRLMYNNETDPNIIKALEIFKEGKSVPEPPR